MDLAQIVITFNMPLFMLICGFFSVNSMKMPFMPFVKKSIQLLVPTISISLLTCLIIIVLNSGNPWSECRNEIIGGMYFLRVLWMCFIIAYVFKRICKYEWLAILTSCVLLFLFPKGTFLRLNFFLLFFWTGYLIKKHLTFFSENRLMITIIALALFVCLPKGEPQVVTLDSLMEEPLKLIQYYVAGFSGSLVVINFAYYLCQCAPHSHILISAGKVGMFTLGIYGLQSIIINRLSYHYIHFNAPELLSEYVLVPVCSLLYVIICYYLVIYLRKIKTFNFLLFGNQY